MRIAAWISDLIFQISENGRPSFAEASEDIAKTTTISRTSARSSTIYIEEVPVIAH
jgi:hypothetical protein